MTRPWRFIGIESLSSIKSSRWLAIHWDGADIAKIVDLAHEQDAFSKDKAQVDAWFMNRQRQTNVS
jgi:hypothetical protein